MKKCKKKCMSPYIETIRLQDGELKNLPYHQKRFEKTRSEELGLKNHPKLKPFVQIPDGLYRGLYRCRIRYGKDIELIEYESYQRRQVSSLKLVYPGEISYRYKYSDRPLLDKLYAKRGACDDILIAKEGYLTDTYYANTVFWDGRNWYTPDRPLLAGTMRASLLDRGLISEAKIGIKDLGKFEHVRLINAMNDLDEGPEVNMDQVIL